MAYPGGKSQAGVYQRLINLMPPHAVYIEPFLGGGAVLLHKRAALFSVGIDVDGDALRVVADRLAWAGKVPSTVAGAANAAGDGTAGAPPATSAGLAVLASLAGHDGTTRCDLLHGDALAWLRARAWTGNELVYLDPPYLMHTRTDPRRRYAYEPALDHGDDLAWHVDLLALALGLPCMVMISGYWSGLYADMLGSWATVSYPVRDRAGKWRDEFVWMNYPAPVALHDYGHLGDDYRERERIKRKRLRWRKRLAGMDLLERRAILAELGDVG